MPYNWTLCDINELLMTLTLIAALFMLPQLETIQLSTPMNKEIMVYPYIGLLLSNEKERFIQ